MKKRKEEEEEVVIFLLMVVMVMVLAAHCGNPNQISDIKKRNGGGKGNLELTFRICYTRCACFPICSCNFVL